MSDGLSRKRLFELLEQQQYRCAISGRELTPENATVDHVVPLAKGGEHCASNAQLLDDEINRAKGTKTNEEFLAICQEVVAHNRGNHGELRRHLA